MVEQRPSGWYDDPHDADLLRYWDGVVWTEHVANRRPTPAGQGVSEPAAGASAQEWAQYHAQQAGPQRTSRREATRRAGWWRRVFALLLDGLLVMIVCLPLTWSRAERAQEGMTAWIAQFPDAASTAAQAPMLPTEVIVDLGMITLIQTLMYVLLESAFLSRSGVTPGRRIVGLRVRPVGVDAPVPFLVGLRRTVIKNVINIFSGIPFVSWAAAIFQAVDLLWPLRDPRRQALHDKAAGTEVVVSGPLRSRDRAARGG